MLLDIIRKPVLTEKANKINGIHAQYVFEVDPKANKTDIRAAVEHMFQVNVEEVRTARIKGKHKVRFTKRGVMSGTTKLRKKAFVRLKAGQKIDLVSGEGDI